MQLSKRYFTKSCITPSNLFPIQNSFGIIIITVFTISLAQGQVVDDPFSTCPVACTNRIDAALKIIAELENRLNNLNLTVITQLTSGGGGGDSSGNADPSGSLNTRLSSVESFLYNNMTSLTTSLSTEIAGVAATNTKELTGLRTYVDDRFSTLPTGGGGGADNSAQVYRNLTTRIDTLEYVKLQYLVDENKVWKNNFITINKTFAKLKKSRYNNDVILVG